MTEKKGIDWALLLPLLVCGALVQITVPLTRIYTTYLALDLSLPQATLGLLSSAFALLPVLFAVRIGRHNDAKGEGGSALVGASLVLVSSFGLVLLARDFVAILLLTATLGIGQLMVIAALQTATTRCSSHELQDKVLGNFLIATSIGQAIGPLFITATTPAGALEPGAGLAWVIGCAAIILWAATAAMTTRLPPHQPAVAPVNAKLKGLFGVPGLTLVIVASGLTVAANDLMLVFLPALGAARGIEASVVGVLLSLRAVASITSRVIFARLAGWIGKRQLLTISMSAGSVALLGLFIELPVWALGLLLIGSGLATGLATAASISLALSLAPAGLRSTTVSLRLTANRLGQFVIPLAAGSATTLIGPAGVFLLSGLAMAASATSLIRTSAKDRKHE